MSIESARERVALAWCQPTTSHITMIPELAEEFAVILEDIWSKPWLCNATTGLLLDELRARTEVGDTIDYKAVGAE